MAKNAVFYNPGLWEAAMQLRQLEVFRAMMVNGTVTAAARALQVSQPAASNAIRNLERSLGMILFQRAKGRLRPTPEAQSLHEEVDRIFRSIAMVERHAHDLKEAQAGVLTLACTPSLSSGPLAEQIARFRAAHPRVQVWLQVTSTREVVDQALKRQIDFGVIYTPADESGLTVEPLYTTELVCVLRPDHRLASRRVLGPQELRNETLIINVRNDPMFAMLEEAFRPIEIRRQARIGTNYTVAACALVEAGAGVAVVEPISVKRLFPGLAIRPFRPRLAVTPRVIASDAQPMSRLARRFVAQLRQMLADDLPTRV
jgi:DNA-binding transcriptional LysR family regulator